jgi:hypothetical protein
MPTPSTMHRWTAAYPNAVVLGMDTFAKGENDSEPASGVCFSYAARRHSDCRSNIHWQPVCQMTAGWNGAAARPREGAAWCRTPLAGDVDGPGSSRGSLWATRHDAPLAAVIAPSGQMLHAAANGDVDVVITHAPALEERILVAPGHAEIRCRLVASRFAIVGPTDDPAGVARAPRWREADGRLDQALWSLTTRLEGSTKLRRRGTASRATPTS